MFCPKCGAKNPDGAKFCGACGEPFRSAPAPAPAAAPTAAAPGAAPTTFPQAAPTTGKTLPKKTIAIVAGAVVVVVAVVAVALTLFGGGKPFEGTIDIANAQLVATDTSMTVRANGEAMISGSIDETRHEGGSMIYELDDIMFARTDMSAFTDVDVTVAAPDGVNSGNAVGEWRCYMDVRGTTSSGEQRREITVLWADVRDDGTVAFLAQEVDSTDQAAVELLDPFSDDFDPEAGGAHVMTASWDKNDDGTYTFVNESGQQTTLTITPSK